MRLIIFGLLTVSIGCTHRATSTRDNPDCPTAIFGQLHYATFWTKGRPPALIRYHNYQHEILYGKIVSINEDGVVFDRDRGSMVFDPDETFYPMSEVSCLIDSNRQIVLGNIPDKYYPTWQLEMGILPVNGKKTKPITIKVLSNEMFSYCFEPGIYRIVTMQFKRGQNYTDIGYEFPQMTFEVVANKNNYLGDLRIDNTDPTVFVLCRPGKREIDALLGVPGSGGGIVGVAVLEAVKRSSSLSHGLTIVDSSMSTRYQGMELNQSVIRVH